MAAARNRLQSQYGVTKGSLADTLVSGFLEYLGDGVLRYAVEQELGGGLADRIIVEHVARMLATLPDAAGAQGDPSTISLQELSTHVIGQMVSERLPASS